MQYNDNIPAVFGLPLVIPQPGRGGTENGEEKITVLGNGGLFLCSTVGPPSNSL